MEKSSSILIAGSKTLLGSACVRQLKRQGYAPLVSDEMDLTDPVAVSRFFDRNKPEFVFLAAGKSGGIHANQTYPADLILDNLVIQSNVIENACRFGVKKLIYLASSCCYPKSCPQPMRVESLWSGPLEPTNQAYATAKLAGIELCRAFNQQHQTHFIAAIPANAFGIGDDFHPDEGHVIPALIRKMHEAKTQASPSVTVWGSGKPRREFIFADDVAEGCIFLLQNQTQARPINVGGGQDVSIQHLAEMIRDVVGFEGQLRFDPTKPDGMPVKVLDSTPLQQLGWHPSTTLGKALETTYTHYRETLHAEQFLQTV